MRFMKTLLGLFTPFLLLAAPIDTVWTNTYDNQVFKKTYQMVHSGNGLVATSGFYRTGLWSVNLDGTLRYSVIGEDFPITSAGRVLYPLEADSLLLICSYGHEPDSYIGLHTITPDGNVTDSTYINTPDHHYIITEIDRFSNGDFVVTGADDIYRSGIGRVWQQRLLRFSVEGDSIWSQSYYGNDLENDTTSTSGVFMDLIVINDEIYSLGSRNRFQSNLASQLDLSKIASDGTTIWSVLLPDHGGSAIERTPDSRIFISGSHTFSDSSAEGSEFFVAELDTSGDILTQLYYDIGGWSGVHDMILNEAGNLMLAGINTDEITNRIFLAEVNLSCDTLWTKIIDTPDLPTLGSIVEVSSENYYLCSSSGRESIIYYFAQDGVSIVEWPELKQTPTLGHLSCYPNPSNNQTTIQVESLQLAEISIAIYDIKGKLLFRKSLGLLQPGQHEFIWNGNDSEGYPVSSGTYFVKVNSPNQSQTLPIVMLK